MKAIHVIANPTAASGRTGRSLGAIMDALRQRLGEVVLHPTQRPDHATELAANALRAGAETIVAVGGDGTVSEVVNGFFATGNAGQSGARLGIIMRGTGGDIRRTYGIGHALGDQIEVIAGDNTRPIDIGKASFIDHDGNEATRYFCNTLSFGMSGKVCTGVKDGLAARLGGKAGFFYASLRAAVSHQSDHLVLSDGQDWSQRGKFNTVVLANGRYFGGSMLIAPEAVPDDGLFDLVAIGDLSRGEVFTSMPKIYSGRHLGHPKVLTRRVNLLQARAEPEAQVLLEVDGEGPGRLPLEVKLLPRALEVLVP